MDKFRFRDNIDNKEKIFFRAYDVQNERQKLLLALRDARNTIRTWHGMNMDKATEEMMWELYQKSPEIKRLNETIKELESDIAKDSVYAFHGGAICP